MDNSDMSKSRLIEEIERLNDRNRQLVRELEFCQYRADAPDMHYKHLFENATIGLYRTTPGGKILEANKKLLSLMGFSSLEELQMRDLSKEGFEPDYSRAEFLELLKTMGEISGLEASWRRKDGRWLFIRETARAYFEPDGEIAYIEGTVEDITERKVAEEELRRQRDYIQTINDSTSTIIYLYDLEENRNIYTNRGMEAVLGYSSEEIIEMGENLFFRLMHPDDIHIVASNTERLSKAAPGESVESEYRMKHANGEWRWLSCKEVVFKYGKNNAPRQVLGNAVDITERKAFEEELEYTRDLLRTVIDLVPNHIHAKTEDSTFLLVNRTSAESFDMEPEEIVGKKHSDIATNRIETERMLEEDLEVIRSGRFKFIPLEQYTDAFGNTRWLQTTKVPFEYRGQKAVLVVGNDITELKKAEDALKESEEIYRSIIQQSSDGIAITDEYGRLLEWNKSIEEITGISKNEAMGRPIWKIHCNLLPAEKQDQKTYEHLKNSIRNMLNGQGIDWAGRQYETVIVGTKGEKKFIEGTSYLIRSQHRMLFGSNVRDITQKHISEEKIRAEQEQLLSIFDSIDIPIYIENIDTYEILFVNKVIKKIFPATEIGNKCYEALFGIDQPCEFCMNQRLSGDGADVLRWEIHNNLVDRDFLMIERNIRWTDGRDVKLSMMIDITERKKMEELLRESESKMRIAIESKDKFFSILAHDLRAPLSGFMGLSQMLSQEFGQMTKEELEETHQALNESSVQLYKLLENLLEWSQMQRGQIKYEPELINILDIMGSCIGLFESQAARKNIRLISEIDRPYYIYADRRMMETVCRNILSNAIKFTPEGGIVGIGARNHQGRHTVISVTDNGIGMGSGKIKELFKLGGNISSPGTANERGTGLGLVLCKELIEKNCGEIKVESAPGSGSTFQITLPSMPPEEADAEQ